MNRKRAIYLFACGLTAGCGGGRGGRGTYFSFVSDPDDYIGAGQTKRLTEQDRKWLVSANETGSHLSVWLLDTASPPLSWFLNFSGSDSERLTLGTYAEAQRWPFQSAGHPGISIVGENRSGNEFSGNFTIHEIEVFNSAISRLFITFEQRSDNADGVLRGELSIDHSIF